ncbi:hypothetical protein EYF80_025969 [Liparis tanakae]|uniref:Uncharacterized protein n=1 Tax=Liparis tanakae TaxID=230148 RepID=A0A4Z2HD13_9TELE|nr:hypothetical protein EYF80_025969 [Liparis tanakae]
MRGGGLQFHEEQSTTNFSAAAVVRRRTLLLSCVTQRDRKVTQVLTFHDHALLWECSGIYPGMAQNIMAADLQYPGCMQPRAHPELVP